MSSPFPSYNFILYWIRLLAVTAMLVSGAFTSISQHSSAADVTESLSPRKVLVFSVGDEKSSTGLLNAGVDAQSMADIFQKRYRFNVNEKHNRNPDQFKFDCQHLINDVVNSRENKEQIVFYFRGFLTIDNGAAWLTAVDSQPSRTDSTSYSVSSLVAQLRQVEHCPLVTILLDVVSESTPADIDQALKAAVSQAGINNTPVAVFAASNRPSDPTWTEVGQSRMSYWLVDGLRGSAINPASAASNSVPGVELDALIQHTREHLDGHSATFVVTSKPISKSMLITPARHRTLDELAEDLAERAATQLREKGTKTVVVPDFILSDASHSKATGKASSKVPGNDYAPLLRYLTTKFKAHLSQRSYGKFHITESMFVRRILMKHRLTPNNLNDAQISRLRDELDQELGADRTPAVLLVSMEHGSSDPDDSNYHSGAGVTLTCSPLPPKGVYLSGFDGTAILQLSEWAMIGQSAVNQKVAANYIRSPLPTGVPASGITKSRIDASHEKLIQVSSSKLNDSGSSTTKNSEIQPSNKSASNSDRRPKQTSILFDFFEPDDVQQVRNEIRQMQQDSERPNPLLDPGFPWRISLKVEGETLHPEFSKNKRHAYVNVAQGTTYSIGIENLNNQPVFLRLLVDGLNTLPDKPLLQKQDKFEVAVKDTKAKLQPAQYVSLTNARAWFCDPTSKYEVRGFFTGFDARTGGPHADATLRTFVVTDASSSEAALNGHLKDVGIITAAFYIPRSKTSLSMSVSSGNRTVYGTKLGEEQNEKVERYEGQQVPGELLGVVHLRYGIRNDENTQTNTPVVQ